MGIFMRKQAFTPMLYVSEVALFFVSFLFFNKHDKSWFSLLNFVGSSWDNTAVAVFWCQCGILEPWIHVCALIYLLQCKGVLMFSSALWRVLLNIDVCLYKQTDRCVLIVGLCTFRLVLRDYVYWTWTSPFGLLWLKQMGLREGVDTIKQ